MYLNKKNWIIVLVLISLINIVYAQPYCDLKIYKNIIDDNGNIITTNEEMYDYDKVEASAGFSVAVRNCKDIKDIYDVGNFKCKLLIDSTGNKKYNFYKDREYKTWYHEDGWAHQYKVGYGRNRCGGPFLNYYSYIPLELFSQRHYEPGNIYFEEHNIYNIFTGPEREIKVRFDTDNLKGTPNWQFVEKTIILEDDHPIADLKVKDNYRWLGAGNEITVYQDDEIEFKVYAKDPFRFNEIEWNFDCDYNKNDWVDSCSKGDFIFSTLIEYDRIDFSNYLWRKGQQYYQDNNYAPDYIKKYSYDQPGVYIPAIIIHNKKDSYEAFTYGPKITVLPSGAPRFVKTIEDVVLYETIKQEIADLSDNYVEDKDHDFNELSFSFSSNAIVVCSIENNKIYCDPKNLGSSEVTVTVTDPDTYSNSISFNVEVKKKGAPEITEILDQQAGVNKEWKYIVEVNQPYDEILDLISYSLLKKPEGMIIDIYSGEITWTPTQKGSYDILVHVSETDGTDNEEFIITVVEHPGYILCTEDVNCESGKCVNGVCYNSLCTESEVSPFKDNLHGPNVLYNNPDIKAMCVNKDNNIKWDKCKDGKVIEYACNEYDECIEAIEISCEEGEICKNGECIVFKECKDSDAQYGKDDIHYKGTCEYFSNNEKITNEDECFVDNEKKYLREFRCIKQIPFGVYFPDGICFPYQVECNCVDKRCLTQEEIIQELLKNENIKKLHEQYGDRLIDVLKFYIGIKKKNEDIIYILEDNSFNYVERIIDWITELNTQSKYDSLRKEDWLQIVSILDVGYNSLKYFGDSDISLNSPLYDMLEPLMRLALLGNTNAILFFPIVMVGVENKQYFIDKLIKKLGDENLGGDAGMIFGRITEQLEKHEKLEESKILLRKLMLLLSDEDKGPNAAYALGTGMIKLENYPIIVSEIIGFLEHEDKNVRGNSVFVIRNMAANFYVKKIDSNNPLYNSITPLINILDDRDIEKLNKRFAINALERITKKLDPNVITKDHPMYQAIQPLMNFLGDKYIRTEKDIATIGSHSIRTLREIAFRLEDNTALINSLIEKLKNENAGTDSVKVLVNIVDKLENTEYLIEPLIGLLGDENAGTNAAIVLATVVKKLEDKTEILIRLVNLLDDESTKINVGLVIGSIVNSLKLEQGSIKEGDTLYGIIDVLINSFENKKAAFYLGPVLGNILLRLEEDKKIEFINRLINDLINKENLREGIALALGQIGKKIGHDALADYLKNENVESIELFITFTPYLSPSDILIYMLKIPLFSQIYNHNELNQREEWERNSITLAVYRFIKNSGYDIDSAITYILQRREQFKDEKILNSNTYFITFVHEDPLMYVGNTKDFAKERGAKIVEQDFVGPDDKEAIRNSIIQSKQQGKTTIWIYAHGLPNYVCLGGGLPRDQRFYGVELSCFGFRFNDFADILLARGDLDNLILIIDSCFSYNFAEQLLDDLEIKGTPYYPIVITASNKGKFGWGEGLFQKSQLLDSLYKVISGSEPLLGKHIYEAEEHSFKLQDSAVFFSEDRTKKSIEIAKMYLNHECTDVMCVGGICS